MNNDIENENDVYEQLALQIGFGRLENCTLLVVDRLLFQNDSNVKLMMLLG